MNSEMGDQDGEGPPSSAGNTSCEIHPGFNPVFFQALSKSGGMNERKGGCQRETFTITLCG